MISSLLSIIARLIKIKELRNKRVTNIYKEIAVPLFNDLELIHRDYDHIFFEAQKLVFPTQFASKEMQLIESGQKLVLKAPI